MEDTQLLISVRAYQMWEQEGRPHGRDQAHWYEAERQLRKFEVASSGSSSSASASPSSPRRDRKRR